MDFFDTSYTPNGKKPPMDFAQSHRKPEDFGAVAQSLVEALPWIENSTGKTVLIKYGGSAMENPELMSGVMQDILLL